MMPKDDQKTLLSKVNQLKKTNTCDHDYNDPQRTRIYKVSKLYRLTHMKLTNSFLLGSPDGEISYE